MGTGVGGGVDATKVPSRTRLDTIGGDSETLGSGKGDATRARHKLGGTGETLTGQ